MPERGRMFMQLHSCYHRTPHNPFSRPVNERLISARLKGKHGSITVAQFYAPTKDSSKDEKGHFYSRIKTVVEQIPTHDVLVVMGDLNTITGNENVGLEKAMEKHGCGKMN